MYKYEITIKADRSGYIRHVVKAESEEAAKERLRAAYAGQDITFVQVLYRRPE